MRKKSTKEERAALTKRLRRIRINLGYTQEKFAEILGISLTAYKKLERAENQITLDGLRTLNKELHISADYLLFGTYSELEGTWTMVQNCTEDDKMRLMLRILAYFLKVKDEKFITKDALQEIDERITRITE